MKVGEEFDIRERPADLELVARGRCLEETIQNACRGFWYAVMPLDCETFTDERIVHGSGSDLEEALVSLMNEQIALLETEGFIASEVRLLGLEYKPESVSISLSLRGEYLCRLGKPPDRILKAATFHDLFVGDREISIVFDI